MSEIEVPPAPNQGSVVGDLIDGDEGGRNGMTLYIKVNYKVILLVLILSDAFTTSLNEFIVRAFD